MKYKFDHHKHSTFTLNYHLVQCIKYRRNVLDFPEIIDELKARTISIAEGWEVEIISQETDLNHIHILFKASPKTNLIKFINNWKTATSRVLKNRFRDRIQDKLWKGVFWANSYCLITTGQVTLDKLKKYVESQGE